MQAEQLEGEQMRLRTALSEQKALLAQRKALEEVLAFSAGADRLNLAKQDWLFYDVNVTGAFSYETALQIVKQCNDSDLAYYWPISLEIRRGQVAEGQTVKRPANTVSGDVSLTVKGKFVARR